MITDLKVIDNELVEIGGEISDISLLNPTDAKKERNKFLKSQVYNPRFKYEILPFNVSDYLKRLDDIKPDDSDEGVLFDEIKERMQCYLTILLRRGSNYTDTSLYGIPSDDLVKKAYSILDEPQSLAEEEKKIFNAQEMKRLLFEKSKKYIKGYDNDFFEGWQFLLEPLMSARMSVNPARREVKIKEDERFSETDVTKLAVHEIAGHTLRTNNGRRQPLKVLSTEVVPGYLSTEEGLALRNEDKANVLSKKWLREYAGRVVAVHLAQTKSFRDTFNGLKQYFSPEKSFTLTQRAKRPLGDTSQPGGLLKDHVYLEGYLTIRDYEDSGGDLTPLWAGKIGLQHLWLWEKGILRRPKYVPRI